MRGLVTLVMALASLGFGHAAIIDVIDLNAKDSSNGEELWLEKGTYEISFLQGTYTAWNAWGRTSGCADDGTNCTNGWLTNFNVISDELGTLKLGRNGKYGSAELAWENAVTETFTLSVAQSVKFFIGDHPYTDNKGGVSLQVASVPVPAAGLIFATALLGYRSLRSRR